VFDKIKPLSIELSNITPHITSILNKTYDTVAVPKERIISAANHYDLQYDSWHSFCRDAPITVMEQMANGFIADCSLKVAGLGTALGAGGIISILPDTVQFLGFTLRMVTAIAAAYGFDPAPDNLEGRVKIIVLQAYLNGNLGHSSIEGVERLGISAVTKYLKTVPMRTNFLMKLIVGIGKIFGIRVTRNMLLKGVPMLAAGISGALNYKLAQDIGERANAEFKTFRREIREGKYSNDPDYTNL
jgi:hypothetical protein